MHVRGTVHVAPTSLYSEAARILLELYSAYACVHLVDREDAVRIQREPNQVANKWRSTSPWEHEKTQMNGGTRQFLNGTRARKSSVLLYCI